LLAALGPDIAPPAFAAGTLTVESDSRHSDLHVAEVGDTLRIVVVLHDERGIPQAGAPIRLKSVSRPSPFLPIEPETETDLDGRARFGLRVGARPGDHLLLASRPGSEEAEVGIRVRVLARGWLGRLIVTVAGGLALFLFGMRMMGRALEKVAGARLRGSLERMTRSPWASVGFGLVSTMLVQSSSASTVLLVSFVSSGLLTLRAGLGAVLGAAVGSTLTVQLIAFRVSAWALLLVAIGFVLTLVEQRRARRIGGAVLGLGLVFYGLRVVADAFAPLDGMGSVVGFFLAAAENPVPAMVAAAIFTAIAQASAATLGIVLGLSLQGILPLEAALPFVLGANVGTTTTALIASVGASPDGRRVAWAHASYRLGGALLCLPFLGPFAHLVSGLTQDPARQVAHAFTILNVGTALLFIPFLPVAEWIFRRLIPDARPVEDAFAPRSLDPRFHEQPDIAVAGALQEVLRMGQLVRDMLDGVKESVRRDDAALADSVRDLDDRVDRLDEAITRYLTELNTEALSKAQSARVLDLLFITKDLELMADIVSKGLVPGLLRKKRKHGLRFSEEGFRELLDFHDRVREVVELAVAAVATWNAETAQRVLDRKKSLSGLERRMHVAHLERLQAGNEASRATTTVHVDAVTDLKRIVSHAARIAYVVLGQFHELPRDEEVVMGDRES
jgi:phosphate:Na+ symporter